MAYKFSKGEREFGDITAENDVDGNTKIDFEEDYIALVTAGSSVLVVSGSQVGVGTTTPTEILTLNAPSQGAPTISFKADNSEIATIGMNSSENIVIENKASNRPIVFKASDGGISREGLRINPNGISLNPEVVINEGSDSLVDFRVESDNNEYMLFVDGANDRIGINVQNPGVTFEVNGDAHISGSASFADVLMTELSIPGIDVTTDTNAYRFNCPYNLTVTGLILNMDQHSTTGPVQVTVTNSTTSNTMITLNVAGTSLAGSTGVVSNASAAQGDAITFAITTTPADVQGLRATLQFRRDL